MKKSLFTLFIATVLLAAACKKSSDQPEPPAAAQFEYVSLVAKDTIMTVNDINTITATAKGDGLKYKWTASYGTFLNSGSVVQWTVCHQARFTITCEVTDQYNHSESKTITVSVMSGK